MAEIFRTNYSQYGHVEQLRGAIAAAVPRWLREQFVVLLPLYNKTLMLMQEKGAIKTDAGGIWSIPLDFLLRRSVPLTESAYQSPFTNFEPNNNQGFRGIAEIAREENEMYVARWQAKMRKLETSFDWYSQDITLGGPNALTEFVERRLRRLTEGEATELNEMLWNFTARAEGAWDGVSANVVYDQSVSAYSIPFMINIPHFAVVRATAGGARTPLKALAPDNVPADAEVAKLGFFSFEPGQTTMALTQEVGGLRRGAARTNAHRFWNGAHVEYNSPRTPRRLNHFISGLRTTATTFGTGAAGIGTTGTAEVDPGTVVMEGLSHFALSQLYNSLMSDNVMPDVLVTHPNVVAWMENQTWIARRYYESMRQVFGMNVPFFLDVPVKPEPLVVPAYHTANITLSNTTYQANTPLYHLYFLKFGGEDGLMLMLEKDSRPVRPYDVPVPADYYMGAYYTQLVMQNPLAGGAALNFHILS